MTPVSKLMVKKMHGYDLIPTSMVESIPEKNPRVLLK